MFAKQALGSASLVVVLVGRSVIAQADPEAPAKPSTGEVRAPTGRFEVGAGFSSTEGFIAHARVAQDSLFGSGHALYLDATVSARYQSFGVKYRTADLGGGMQLTAELYDRRRQMPGFVREAAGGALTLSQRVTEHLSIFAGYRLERVAVDDSWLILARGEPGTAPGSIADTRIGSVNAGFVYDSRDNPYAPLRGSLVGASYEVADPRFGSTVSFDRVRAWAGHHRGLGPLTLHLTGSLTQVAGRNGDLVPRSERLYLDRADDIRGFMPGSLDPSQGFGLPVGGTLKWTTRAELEVPLVRRAGLSAVGFYDMGGIHGGGIAALGRSVGVGLLWRSPIGPLRFDWAFPLDGAGPPRFLFSMGGDW